MTVPVSIVLGQGQGQGCVVRVRVRTGRESLDLWGHRAGRASIHLKLAGFSHEKVEMEECAGRPARKL
jgi:hypothetical protein